MMETRLSFEPNGLARMLSGNSRKGEQSMMIRSVPRRFHNSGPNKPAQIGLRAGCRIYGFCVCKHSYREKE